MPLVQLPLTPEQFEQLPRNAAYRYDHVDGVAWLNPRPRYYHALLDLEHLDLEAGADVAIRLMRPDDTEPLIELFTQAFRWQQPFGGQSEAKRAIAARMSLEQTRRGGDGPWIEQASFVAEGSDGERLGAIFITLLPLRDPNDWDAYHWSEPPPADCIARRQGRPHLTWVFVHPRCAGHGVGTALLQTACEELRAMGFTSLLSTFLLGNESSMMWHWRVGFRLLTYPASPRHYRAARDEGISER
jgi:GNAT superfamily N-acetyltransferase